MDDRESIRRNASLDASLPSMDSPSSYVSSNDELLSGTGSIPIAASSTGSFPASGYTASAGSPGPSTASASSTPRYVRKRTPHRSQGTLDDLNDESIPSAAYTHDSNISVGGSTPLSGMAYRRARNSITRVQRNTRYGHYLEIPKGRRSIFASRERARRRRSVIALFAVIILLVIAAMILWNMMQSVLG